MATAPDDVAEGGLVRMLLVKVSDETLVHNVLSRNPGSFLWTVALPVNEVLAAPSTSVRADDAAHSIDESPFNEARGGGEGGAAGTSWLSLTGLTLDTWNVGCTRIDRGSLSRTATGLMTFSMAKGPTNLGASLLDSKCRGRSRVESQTFWPTWYSGA